MLLPKANSRCSPETRRRLCTEVYETLSRKLGQCFFLSTTTATHPVRSVEGFEAEAGDPGVQDHQVCGGML